MLNQTGNANRNFVYNPRGHLASSSGWLGNRTYAYDGFDRLKSTTVDGTTTTRYLINALDQRVGKTGPLGTFQKRCQRHFRHGRTKFSDLPFHRGVSDRL